MTKDQRNEPSSDGVGQSRIQNAYPAAEGNTASTTAEGAAKGAADNATAAAATESDAGRRKPVPAGTDPASTSANSADATPPQKLLSASFRIWIDRLKETLGIAKDALDVLIKLSPLALLPPAAALWVYLKRIGWTEIYLDSVGSVAGLTTLLVCAFLLLLALFLQFCLPSLLIAPAAAWLEVKKQPKGADQEARKGQQDVQVMQGKQRNAKGVSAAGLAGLHLLPAFVWLVTFSLLVWLADDHAGSGAKVTAFVAKLPDPVWVAAIFAGIAAVTLSWQFQQPQSKSALTGFAKFMNLVLLAFCPFMGAVASGLSLLALTWIFGGTEVAKTYPYLLLGAFCVLGLIGLIPGFVYLDGQFSDNALGNTLTSTFAVTFGVAYLVIGAAVVFAPVTSVVLRMAGVFDARRGIYQLLTPELGYTMRAAHLPTYGVAGTAHGGEPPVQFVDAYLQYNFGGMKLLCRTSYDPDSAPSGQPSTTAPASAKNTPPSAAPVPKVETKTKKALPANHDKPVHHVKTVPAASGKISDDSNGAMHRTAAVQPALSPGGDWCVPVKADEIRPVHRNTVMH